MAKYKQTDQDLRNHLCEQLRFLRASAASFDEGVEGEAKRLAATIRLLVHDAKKSKSKSLLHQLNLKHAIRMHIQHTRLTLATCCRTKGWWSCG